MTRLAHDQTDLAHEFGFFVAMLGPDLPTPKREYKFHPERRWRFDFAFVEQRLAVECDGGQWVAGGGRHNGDPDREKLNQAAILGWRVLRFSTRQIQHDPIECVRQIRVALAYKE